MRIPRTSCLVLGLAIAGSASAQEIRLDWDPSLAFEGDRGNYAQLLRERVRAAYREVSGALGITLRRPLEIRVLTPAGFAAQFGEERAFTVGAQYREAAIHVNGGNRQDDRFQALLEHELVHALLDTDGRSGCLPTWLNEGLAERFRWRKLGIEKLAPNQIAELQRAQAAGALTPLVRLGPLSPFGYLQSFAALLFLEVANGPDAPGRLAAAILADCDPAKGLASLRTDQADLERRFALWVRELS